MKMYSKIKHITLVCMVLMLAGSAVAQDIHFSQFYASPLTLNPALTGRMNGDYRLAGIYRAQWRSLSTDPKFNAYSTPAASFDIPFVFGKKKNNAIGAGILFVNDITNNRRFNTLQAIASVAYIKALDKDFKHQLSLGIQGGMRQTTIKTSEFIFGDQFNNGVFDPNITSIDNIGNNSKTIPVFNTGLFYSARLAKQFTIFSGFSLFNIGEPTESQLQRTFNDSKLPMRWVVHGGIDWGITERISFLPGVIWMTQAQAREINFGANFGFDVSTTPGKEATLYLGGWYRWEDAVSPMLAIELMKRFRVGFSYDVNTSSLNTATNNRGGFEVSLIYIGRIMRINEVNLFCPRF